MNSFIIDGTQFDNLSSFYDEVELKLTKDLDWKIGRNLDAFNDVLRGGFGAFDYEDTIELIWTNSAKSKSPVAARFQRVVPKHKVAEEYIDICKANGQVMTPCS